MWRFDCIAVGIAHSHLGGVWGHALPKKSELNLVHLETQKETLHTSHQSSNMPAAAYH